MSSYQSNSHAVGKLAIVLPNKSKFSSATRYTSSERAVIAVAHQTDGHSGAEHKDGVNHLPLIPMSKNVDHEEHHYK